MTARRLGRSSLHVQFFLFLAALSLCASACSIDETMPLPTCNGGSSLIAAQSVPSATLLPCFDPLPEGWEVDRVNIDDSGTTITFDSDRAGDESARFFFDDECERDDAVATPTDTAGALRFEEIRQLTPSFEASRFYVFPGGCVWWDFSFDPNTPSAMSVELDNALHLRDRKAVNDSLRETFVDEDL